MYKINNLLKANQDLFHTSDIASIWGISNKNTLYTSIKRYVGRGVLIPVHKGFYATKPIEQIDSVRLGVGFLHNFAYQSCENILVEKGIIFQNILHITLISNRSCRFTIGSKEYLVRKIADKFLYNTIGILETSGVYKATLERAVADILYFQPNYFFDAKDNINWRQVKKIQKEVYSI